jgi:hypothetical protein
MSSMVEGEPNCAVRLRWRCGESRHQTDNRNQPIPSGVHLSSPLSDTASIGGSRDPAFQEHWRT